MAGRLLIQFFDEQGFVAGHHAQPPNKLFWEKTMSEPREIVESFIRDMNAAFEKYRPLFEQKDAEIKLARNNEELEKKDYEEYAGVIRKLNGEYSGFLQQYYDDRAEVLRKYSIPVPADFFSARSAGSIYLGDEIKDVVSVNKNTTKIFTDNSGKTYERLKIFVVKMQEGSWIITKLRLVNPKTQKDSHLDW